MTNRRPILLLAALLSLVVTAWAGNAITGYAISASYADDQSCQFGTDNDARIQAEALAIPDNTTTTLMSFSSSDGTMYGATLVYSILVDASSGTELQVRTGQVSISFVDASGGVTATVTENDNQNALGTGSFTTVTWSIDTTDDQSIELTLLVNSSLTDPTINVRWMLINTGPSTVTVTPA